MQQKMTETVIIYQKSWKIMGFPLKKKKSDRKLFRLLRHIEGDAKVNREFMSLLSKLCTKIQVTGAHAWLT